MLKEDNRAREILGAKLRRAREERGLTQWQVAIAMGVRRTTISGWEQGRRLPDWPTLQRLARVLNIDAKELIVEDWTDPDEVSMIDRLRRLRADLRALSVPSHDVQLIMSLIKKTQDAKRLEMERRKQNGRVNENPGSSD